MKRKADCFHTELGEWVQVCGVSSGHMVFQSSVVQLFPDLPLPPTLHVFCELFKHF